MYAKAFDRDYIKEIPVNNNYLRQTQNDQASKALHGEDRAQFGP